MAAAEVSDGAGVVAPAPSVPVGASVAEGALLAAGVVLLESLPHAASAAAMATAVPLPRINCRRLNLPGTKPCTGSNAIFIAPLVVCAPI